MLSTKLFGGMTRITLLLAMVLLVTQACVVTAEKKIVVKSDTVEEQDQIAPKDTIGGEDAEPLDNTTEEDSEPMEDTEDPSQEEWTIGADGGTFLFHGGVKLIVPPGAFAQEINVLIGVQAGAELPADIVPLTDTWIIPDLEGFVFNKPVVLVLPILDDLPSELPEGVTWDQLGGFSKSLEGEDWSKLPASIDLLKGELSIPTVHFSLFFGGLGGGSGSSCTPGEEICNGLDDDCDGAIDQGVCAAGEACFLDSMCLSGTCTWTYGGSGAVCAETEGGCVILIGEVVTQVEDGGLLCTSDTTYRACNEGVFTESAECSEGFTGTFLCDAEAGACAGECAEDADCPDADLCDGGKACELGVCVDAGEPVVCEADTDCMKWECQPGTGLCSQSAQNPGGACDDGDMCTGVGECIGMNCIPGDKVECGDGNPCTADSCDSSTGDCIHDAPAMEGEPCNDEVPCTESDACDGAGACAGTPKVCEDTNACTEDSCNAQTGVCSFTPLAGAPCDDLDACTEDDTCSLVGACVGTPAVNCDDLNDCTADSCDPGTGTCVHTPVGLGADCSYPDASQVEGADCYPNAACDAMGVCQPGQGLCDCLVDGDCGDDGDLCNGTQKCNTAAFPYVCEDDPGSVVVCGDGGDCFDLICDPGSGDCLPQSKNEGGACDDGDLCTDGETCAAGSCTGGVADDCDDSDPCTIDSCDSLTGCAHAQSSVLPCSDGDACTTDTCTPDGQSCLFVPIAGCCTDEDDCGGLPCINGSCCVPSCDDGAGGDYECGADGCGGTCGSCEGNDVCNQETHLCVCESCCQDSSECGALEICLDAGTGDTECVAMTPVFQANFDAETVGDPSDSFTYSWPSYAPGWVVFGSSAAPEFANSPPNSLRYNKYKSSGWFEFSASISGAGQQSFLSFMILCPAGIAQNWSIAIKGDGGTMDTVTSAQICGGADAWHHITVPVTELGAGSHAFRFDLTNNAYGTIYMDDVSVLVEN